MSEVQLRKRFGSSVTARDGQTDRGRQWDSRGARFNDGGQSLSGDGQNFISDGRNSSLADERRCSIDNGSNCSSGRKKIFEDDQAGDDVLTGGYGPAYCYVCSVM